MGWTCVTGRTRGEVVHRDFGHEILVRNTDGAWLGRIYRFDLSSLTSWRSNGELSRHLGRPCDLPEALSPEAVVDWLEGQFDAQREKVAVEKEVDITEAVRRLLELVDEGMNTVSASKLKALSGSAR